MAAFAVPCSAVFFYDLFRTGSHAAGPICFLFFVHFFLLEIGSRCWAVLALFILFYISLCLSYLSFSVYNVRLFLFHHALRPEFPRVRKIFSSIYLGHVYLVTTAGSLAD